MFTQLSDKATILCKEKLVSGSGKQLKRGFNEIRDLRDHLAHANYYAETPEAARQVCQWSGRFAASKRTCLQGSKINSSPQGEPPWRPHRREEVDEGLICYNQTTVSAHKYHGRESYAADILEGH